jgi:hypothetical protein
MNSNVHIQVTAQLPMAGHSTLLAKPATSAARMATVSCFVRLCSIKY